MRFNGICLVSQNVRQLRGFYRRALPAEAEGNDTSAKFKTAGVALSGFVILTAISSTFSQTCPVDKEAAVPYCE